MSGGRGMTFLLSTQNLCRKKCDSLAVGIAVFPFTFAVRFLAPVGLKSGIGLCKAFA